MVLSQVPCPGCSPVLKQPPQNASSSSWLPYPLLSEYRLPPHGLPGSVSATALNQYSQSLNTQNYLDFREEEPELLSGS